VIFHVLTIFPEFSRAVRAWRGETGAGAGRWRSASTTCAITHSTGTGRWTTGLSAAAKHGAEAGADFPGMESIWPQRAAGQKVILLSAQGRVFDQGAANRLSQEAELLLICGRYEGVDERVAECLADEELSIGNYVLSGGELPRRW